MEKELIKNIQIDLKNGLTWKAIQDKYELKSDYLIRQARGTEIKQHNSFKYLSVRFNEEELKSLNDNDLTEVEAHLYCINNVLGNKGISNVLKMIHQECKRRDKLQGGM